MTLLDHQLDLQLDHQLDHQAASGAAAAAMAAGDLCGELFAESRVHAVYEVSRGEPITQRIRHEQGMGIRRVTSGGSHYVYRPGLDPDALPALAAAVREGAAVTRGEPARPIASGGVPAVHPTRRRTSGAAASALPLAEGLRVAREAERAALRCADGLDVTARIVVGVQRVLIARPDGAVAQDERRYAALHVEAVARRATQVRKSRRSYGCRDVATMRARGEHLRIAESAALGAVERLDAVPAPSGQLPVVLGPGGPATLLHEACGHALEADLVRWRGSAFHSRRGERVATGAVTLVDDPAFPAEGPLYAFDDEGEPAARTVLIDRGRLTGHLVDRRHALLAGGASNGHGRRLSYAHPPLPRMSGTYLAQGDLDPAEIVAATPRGLYVTSIGGGDTDMGTGRFNLQVDAGYLIDHGRLGAPVRGAVLSGRGTDVLGAIDLVGADLQALSHTYLCNKLDQFPLVVNVGQPTVRVSALSVWGG